MKPQIKKTATTTSKQYSNTPDTPAYRDYSKIGDPKKKKLWQSMYKGARDE